MTKDVLKKLNIRLDWLLYLGIAVLAGWGLYAATISELDRVATRDGTAPLGDYGIIMLRFSTDPHPATPAEPVALNFIPMDSRQNMFDVDEIRYTYGQDGSEQPMSSGLANVVPNSGGLYRGLADMPSTGKWWVNVTVTKGDVQAVICFNVNVKAE